MCGIAGYFGNYDGDLRNNINVTIKKLQNRGPDSNGYFYKKYDEGEQLLLVHTRLKIIDLSERSGQPFVYKNLILNFNGEIYNYLELRKHLIIKGHNFITNSDTEVLIKYFHTYGYRGLDDFEGMFAFSIFDLENKTLTLARDRFGEKPLHYYEGKNFISFSSEINALEKISNVYFEINKSLVFNFLNRGYRVGYENNNINFFKKVKSIKPSYLYKYETVKHKKKIKYWSADLNKSFESKKHIIERVRESLIKSVELRMRSDVPVAFFLSGGVDSNSMISIARNILDKEVTCFSLVAKDKSFEEIKTIRNQVKLQKLNHIELELEKNDFLDNMFELTTYYAAPISTISLYSIWKLYQEVSKKGFKVAISGHGGDEIFSGYYYHHLLYLRDLASQKNLYNQKKKEWAKYVLPYVNNPILRNLDLFLNSSKPPINYLFSNVEDVEDLFLQKKQFSYKEKHYHQDSLKNRMLNEVFHEIFPVVLSQEDLNAMYYSIENRSPFLDKNIFETALSIPTSEFISNGYNKSILRESMKGILPDDIRLNRSKIGLNFSLKEYFDLNNTKNKKFLLSDSPIFEYINKKNLEKLINEEKKFYNNSQFIFNLISSKVFMDIHT